MLLLLLLMCQDLLTRRRWRRLGPLLLLAMLGYMALQPNRRPIRSHHHHLLLLLHLLVLPACLPLLWCKGLHTCISPNSNRLLLLQLLVGKALHPIPRHQEEIYMTPRNGSSTLSS